MTIKYINNLKMVFVTTILFLSILTITNIPNSLLLPQVLGTNDPAPDLPLTAKECKLDTNPNGPSCKPDID